jgi:hypothetical protein
MIASVGLADVAKGGEEVELTAQGGEVVARNPRRTRAELEQESSPRVPIMEISTEGSEREVELALTEGGG